MQQAANGEWLLPLILNERRFCSSGDKSGGSEKRFYRELIRKADDRFDAHLMRIKRKGM